MQVLAQPVLLVVLVFLPCLSAGQSLSETLFETGLQHIKSNGPGVDTEAFVEFTGEHVWRQRHEVLGIFALFLDSDEPEIVSGALRGLYRMRHLGDDHEASTKREQLVESFCREVDEVVYGSVDHLVALEDDRVLKSLALVCGWPATPEAKRTLLRIAGSPHAENAKEQALICLTWHNDREDMQALSPYMLEDCPASSSLPYHFGTSYGEASIPYLKQTVSTAAGANTRLEASFQLVLFKDPTGFKYLLTTLEEDPEPVGKRTRPIHRIRQFAWDRLGLSRESISTRAISEHILMKLQELDLETAE